MDEFLRLTIANTLGGAFTGLMGGVS